MNFLKKIRIQQMTNLLKVISGVMGVIGFVMVFLGVSTSDYYVIEQGQSEPTYVWAIIVIGVILMIPTLVHCIRVELRGERR